MTALNIQTVTLNRQAADDDVLVVRLWSESDAWAPSTCHHDGCMA